MSRPVGAVERAVLDCFAEVLGLDVGGVVEVGDGAGDFQDAVVGAGGKAEARDGALEEFFTIGGNGAVLADECEGAFARWSRFFRRRSERVEVLAA